MKFWVCERFVQERGPWRLLYLHRERTQAFRCARAPWWNLKRERGGPLNIYRFNNALKSKIFEFKKFEKCITSLVYYKQLILQKIYHKVPFYAFFCLFLVKSPAVGSFLRPWLCPFFTNYLRTEYSHSHFFEPTLPEIVQLANDFLWVYADWLL